MILSKPQIIYLKSKAIIFEDSIIDVYYIAAISTKMRIILNKDVQIIPDNISINGLLEHLNIETKYIAIEVNETIVSKSEYNKFSLKENDNVEIINAVGGG